MREITHRTVDTNGIRMRVAEQGEGPLVLLCHGFPESWYSWRHQLPALAAAGYHAVAPDMRGYGGSDRPEAIDQYTQLHHVGSKPYGSSSGVVPVPGRVDFTGRAPGRYHRTVERAAGRLTIGPHRVLLSGPAGSGKTTLLCERARELRRRHPEQRMLVLCFTGALASHLRRALPADPQTDVATFHDWALARLDASGLAIPKPPGRGTQWDRYWTHDMARLLLQAFREGYVPTGVYRAVLVDEGQDFAPDWYHAIALSLDPDDGALFVTVDPAQDIYGRDVAWQDLGFPVTEPASLLTVNHRNSPGIAAAAARLIGGAEIAGDDTAPARDGPAPEVHRCPSFEASRAHALTWVRERLAAGDSASGLLVLGLSRLDMITVNAWLNSKGVPAWLPSEREADAGVRVSTIHGAKGLEAESVLLLDAHHLETRAPDEGRRLLYIAMTRARRELTVSYFRDVPLMAELERACRPR